jgi:glycosyltransferase involved in cell wall biosynthesis/4-amino-4-deoxy-L-arabinose transferase-like glycosyltransferase
MMRRIFLVFHGRLPSEKAAALFVAESAKAFLEMGYEVILVAPKRRGQTERLSMPITYVPTLDLFGFAPTRIAFLISLFAFSVSAYLYLFFKARRDDLIYSNEALALWFASFSFPLTVFELHDYPERRHAFFHQLFSRVHGIVVTNRIKQKRLIQDFPEAESKTLVELNAVDPTTFARISKHEARERLAISETSRIAVYTGHLYRWKGVDTLAEAAKLAPTVDFYVVGGTDEDLKRYKAAWGNVSNLHVVGFRPHAEMPLWQSAADVLVLPNTAQERISAEDTSPMKLFEYIASGRPIVASDLPSIREIVEEGDLAHLVKPDDARALAHAVSEAAERGDQMGAPQTETFLMHHTWQARAKRIMAFLKNIPHHSEGYVHERILFAVGFVVPMLFVILFAYQHQHVPLSNISSDGYIPLAISLETHGVFSYATSPPYVLEAAHTPGYPFFLAFTAAPWGSVLPALVLQVLLFAFSVLFLYRIFAGVFSGRVRFFGALIFALEPYTAYTVAQPLSEALFLFLFLGGILMLRRAFEREAITLLFGAGVLLGLGALVRPIALYLIPLIVLVLLVLRFKQKLFLASVLFSFGALLVLSPWMIRNHEAFGTWALSTKGPYTLYFYDAEELLRYKEGLTSGEAYQKLLARVQATYPEVKGENELRSPKYNKFFTANALQIIESSPRLFIKMYSVSLGTYFLSDGYRLLWYELSHGAITLPNITKAITTGGVRSIAEYFHEHVLEALVFFAGFLFWLVTFMLALGGGLVGLFSPKHRVRYAALAAGFIIAYFALLTGPVAQARYRIVATPFLFMLASYGAALLTSLFYARRSS